MMNKGPNCRIAIFQRTGRFPPWSNFSTPCPTLNERLFTAIAAPKRTGRFPPASPECRPSALGARPSSTTYPLRHHNETKLGNFVVLFEAPPGYPGAMKFHGPILDNLNNAIASARRLRGHPVYKDTLTYWNELIHEARRIQREPVYEQADLLEAAIVSLEVELAERGD